MRVVKMFGPSISDPSKIVNRDVPECDVQAYVAAGYQKGSINELPVAAEVVEEVVEEEAVNPEAEAPKKKGRK